MNKKKVMFISSTGGHLTELFVLEPIFDNYDYYIVTEKTKSTISLKNKYGKRISYLVYGTKDKILIYPFKLFFNTIKSFFIYLKVRPKYIVTTGAHTAGPMCVIGHLFKSKIIFLESVCNVKTKTITGSLVYPFADLFVVHWKSMLNNYPNAIYGGNEE